MVAAPVSLLTVMAHADDAELWAGGTLARHARQGTRVTVALPRTDDIRDKEATAGAQLLGATVHLIDEFTMAAVTALLLQVRPEVVITHNPDDIHPEHQATAHTVLAALPEVVIATCYPHRVYCCDGYHNLDRLGRPMDLPVIVDVTSTWDVKRKALAVHTSQPIDDHFWPMAEALGRLHGGRIETPYAEAFRPIPVLGRMPASPHL